MDMGCNRLVVAMRISQFQFVEAEALSLIWEVVASRDDAASKMLVMKADS
jgi:hypothetical protein